jgi:putative acetyltransferase
MELELKRTTSDAIDFQNLVILLDKELKERDGEEHDFYAQFNKIDALKFCIVCCENGIAIGCGAFKEYEAGIVEIKRMYVVNTYRNQGVACRVLKALEDWALELSYQQCVLETGKKQPEAIRLYEKSGYLLFPNYGQYKNIENSVCLRKTIG